MKWAGKAVKPTLVYKEPEKNIPFPAEKDDRLKDLTVLQSVIDSIHAKKEPQPLYTPPKVEQYDFSEPTLNYD